MKRGLVTLLVAIGACGGDRPPPREPGYVVRDASEPRTASKLPLVPRPRMVETCAGRFGIDASTTLAAPREASMVRARLEGWLGLSPIRLATGKSRGIVLELDPSIDGDEAYVVDVTPERALVRAKALPGLFYGAQTLAVLAGSRPIGPHAPVPLPRTAPCVHIEDAPRVRYRGMHLDVARHFFSKEVVERFVDLLAFYRFNVFHWHLTDDQGFRLTPPTHPEIATAPAYTDADVREVVTEAGARFVDVIPELEMPGHVRAILATHPEVSCTGKPLGLPTTWGIFDDVLCAGNPATYALAGELVGDVARLFPSRYLHLGGDEVPTTRWRACPKCRARMKEEGVDAEHLQGVFLRNLTQVVERTGRRPMVWDDALDAGALPKSTVVMAWRGTDRGVAASRAGYDVVMAPADAVYLDARPAREDGLPGRDAVLPWTTVLAFDPLAPGVDPKHVLGGEGMLWTEHATTEADLDTLLGARLAALGEALWSGRGDPVDFGARFAATRGILDASGVRYHVEAPDGLPRHTTVFLDRARVSATPPPIFPEGVVRFTTDGSVPTPLSPALVWLDVTETTDLAARLFLPNGRMSAIVRARFEKQAPRRPEDVPTALSQGIAYAYVEGTFHSVTELDGPKPTRTGAMPQVALDPSFRAENFGAIYTGWFLAPEDGVYRFVARADDGVALAIDRQPVLTDDGNHAAREAIGEIALAKGLHGFVLRYFQGAGGKDLALACHGPKLDGRCPLMAPYVF